MDGNKAVEVKVLVCQCNGQLFLLTFVNYFYVFCLLRLLDLLTVPFCIRQINTLKNANVALCSVCTEVEMLFTYWIHRGVVRLEWLIVSDDIYFIMRPVVEDQVVNALFSSCYAKKMNVKISPRKLHMETRSTWGQHLYGI